jgi:CoA:oxalate CoA-transferase
MMRPLEGLLVLEFCQYMAGPAAGLRLADLGARVIKIERPQGGDGCRQLAIKHLFVDGDSLVFHTVNRNKESFAADLKDPADRQLLSRLIARADVMTHNFRPGVMERVGLDYPAVAAINPRLVYGEVTGYGPEGPWKDKPGQDLLLQSLSGLTWLSGRSDQGPVPMGLAIVDILCGAHFVQGILAVLVRRGRTGRGGHVEVSLLESILDLQFEVLTTHLADGRRLPQRCRRHGAHAYLAAPYGVYPTSDGYLALGMGDLQQLATLTDCPELRNYTAPDAGFTHRDAIQEILACHLRRRTTAAWLAVLEPADVWCADVLDYARLVAHEGYRALAMEQTVRRGTVAVDTTRCPIRIDGEILRCDRGAPRLGEHNPSILQEFLHA